MIRKEASTISMSKCYFSKDMAYLEVEREGGEILFIV